MTLSAAHLALLADARRATLATIDAAGVPRLVPICFVVADDVLWSPLDEKAKSTGDVRALARVRDIRRDARVNVLVDRWSEDWSELAWLRIVGRAELVDVGPTPIIDALRARYPQYVDHDLESRPMIRIVVERVVAWSASAPDRHAPRRMVE